MTKFFEWLLPEYLTLAYFNVFLIFFLFLYRTFVDWKSKFLSHKKKCPTIRNSTWIVFSYFSFFCEARSSAYTLSNSQSMSCDLNWLALSLSVSIIIQCVVFCCCCCLSSVLLLSFVYLLIDLRARTLKRVANKWFLVNTWKILYRHIILLICDSFCHWVFKNRIVIATFYTIYLLIYGILRWFYSIIVPHKKGVIILCVLWFFFFFLL